MLAVLIHHLLDWFVTQHLLTNTLVKQGKSEVEGEMQEHKYLHVHSFSFLLVEADIDQ